MVLPEVWDKKTRKSATQTRAVALGLNDLQRPEHAMKMQNILFTLICAFTLLLNSVAAFANGALAIDSNHGRAYGLGVNYESMAGAERRALIECGRGCKIVVRFPSACAAYAADQTEGSTVYGWAPANNRDDAKAKAIMNCRKYGGKNCTVRVWGCNSK
jgi:hypothetical protein